MWLRRPRELRFLHSGQIITAFHEPSLCRFSSPLACQLTGGDSGDTLYSAFSRVYPSSGTACSRHLGLIRPSASSRWPTTTRHNKNQLFACQRCRIGSSDTDDGTPCGSSGNARVEAFLSKYAAHKLRPVYPSIVRSKKQNGFTDLQIATAIQRKFAKRASRLRASFHPPEISRT